MITFEFKDNEGITRHLTWYGHFTEKTIEKTLDALLICGMRGNDPRVLAEGPAAHALNQSQEVSVTVEHEKDDDGKIRAKVRWINRVGGAAFKKMAPQDVMRKLGDLRGMVHDRRKETGIKDEPTEPTPDDFDNFDKSVGF